MKKKIPLQVLQKIKPFLSITGDHFHIVQSEQGELLRFVDNEIESGFYFAIKSYFYEARTLMFEVHQKPNSVRSLEDTPKKLTEAELINHFDNWRLILAEYAKIDFPHVDPISQNYADEIYNDIFKITDESDDDIRTYPLKTILALNEYLEAVEKNISDFENDSNKETIKEIKQLSVEIQENATTKTRKWIKHKVSILCGKIAKTGIPAFRKFVSTIGTEFLKELVKEATKKMLSDPEALSKARDMIDSIGK